jgi:IKAROS family zinc finger protein
MLMKSPLFFAAPASRSHYEWLSAYRQSRDFNNKASPEPERPKSISPHMISTQNTPHLRNLLTKQPQEPPASASGFLRSIVQTIMQQNGSSPKPPSPRPDDPKPPTPDPPRIKEEQDSEGDEVVVDKMSSPKSNGKREAEDDAAPASPPRPPHKKRRRKKNATLDDVVRGLASSTTQQGRDDVDSALAGRHYVNQQLRCLLNQRNQSPPSTSPVGDHHLRSVLASQAPEHHSCNTQALISPYEQRKLSDSECEDQVVKDRDYFIGEAQEGQCAVITRCDHCGITFDDEVIFSIHMGCHSHKDPFICNVCGRSCENKYAFYTHIMRGHHNVP